MADSPPVTRKRSRNVDASERAVTRDRRQTGDWKEGPRSARSEETEKVDKTKKRPLVTPLPTNIPGLSGVAKSDAKADFRLIDGSVDMLPLDSDGRPSVAVQATATPPMPSPNRLWHKRQRLATWLREPSKVKQELDVHKLAVARAKEEDLKVELQREEFERWFAVMRAHLTAGHRPMMYWSPAIGNARVGGAMGASPSITLKAAHAGGAGAAVGDLVGTGDDSANAGMGSNDSPLSAMTSGDVDSSFDGNHDGSGDCREGSAEQAEEGVSESKRSQRDGGGNAKGGGDGEGGDDRDVAVSAGASRGSSVSVGSGGVRNAGDVVASHEKKPTVYGDGIEGCGSWKRGVGEHHEGLQWVRCLERLAMKRAHLNGAFDMEKIAYAYESANKQIVEARREYRRLLKASRDAADAAPSEMAPPGASVSERPTEASKTSGGVSPQQDQSDAKYGEGQVGNRGGAAASEEIADGNVRGSNNGTPFSDLDRTASKATRGMAGGIGTEQRVSGKAPLTQTKDAGASRNAGADEGTCAGAGVDRDGGGDATDWGGVAETDVIGDVDSMIRSCDAVVMNRWDQFLRDGDACGSRWRQMVAGGDVAAEAGFYGSKGSFTDGIERRAPLVSRGLDLPPCMRVAVTSKVGRPASNSLCRSGSSQDGEMDSSARETGDGERALLASEHGVPRGKGVAEYMPWIGGGKRIRVCRDGASRAGGKEEGAAEAGKARGDDLRDMIQWFSESLPVEAPPSGNSPDEQESIELRARTLLALEKVRELKSEVSRRQREMEIRRREKADEAMRLVRAASEHEEARRRHERHIGSFRKLYAELERDVRSGLADDGFEDEARADEAEEAAAAAGSPGLGDNSEGDGEEVHMDQSKASTRDEDEEPEDHGNAGAAIDGDSSAGSNATNGKSVEYGDNDSADVGNGGSGTEGAGAPLETTMDVDKGREGEVSGEGAGSSVPDTTATVSGHSKSTPARPSPVGDAPSQATASTSLSHPRSPIPSFAATPSNGLGSESSDSRSDLAGGKSGGKAGNVADRESTANGPAEAAGEAELAAAPPPLLTRERASPRTAASPEAYSSFAGLVAGSVVGDAKKGLTEGGREGAPGTGVAGGKRCIGGSGNMMVTRAAPKRRRVIDGISVPSSVPLTKSNPARAEEACGRDGAPNGDSLSVPGVETLPGVKGGPGAGAKGGKAKGGAKRTGGARLRAKGTPRR